MFLPDYFQAKEPRAARKRCSRTCDNRAGVQQGPHTHVTGKDFCRELLTTEQEYSRDLTLMSQVRKVVKEQGLEQKYNMGQK
jgi:hypothetical protein